MADAHPGRGAGELWEYRIDDDHMLRQPWGEKDGLPERPRAAIGGQQRIGGDNTQGRC